MNGCTSFINNIGPLFLKNETFSCKKNVSENYTYLVHHLWRRKRTYVPNLFSVSMVDPIDWDARTSVNFQCLVIVYNGFR